MGRPHVNDRRPPLAGGMELRIARWHVVVLGRIPREDVEMSAFGWAARYRQGHAELAVEEGRVPQMRDLDARR